MTREGDDFIFEKPEPSEIGVVNLGMIAMTKFGKILKFCQNQPRWPLAFLSWEIRSLA
jgi:hypothetical protein